MHEAGGDATIERVFTLDAAPQALVQSRAGRVRGKLVVAID